MERLRETWEDIVELAGEMDWDRQAAVVKTVLLNPFQAIRRERDRRKKAMQDESAKEEEEEEPLDLDDIRFSINGSLSHTRSVLEDGNPDYVARSINDVRSNSELQAVMGHVKIFGEFRNIRDRFDVYEEIGRGGNAIVYRAWDPVHTRLVALKRIRYRADIPTRAMFLLLQELKFVQMLQDCPYITKLYGAYLVNPKNVRLFRSLNYSLELSRVGSIFTLLDQGFRLSLEDIKYVTACVLLALSRIHSEGLVHSDVKPSNFFVDRRGLVTLGDFGACRLEEDHKSRTLTHSYASPEQIHHDLADPSSMTEIFKAKNAPIPSLPSRKVDTWALGISIIEMYEGDVPECYRFDEYYPRELLEREGIDSLEDVITKWYFRLRDEEFTGEFNPFPGEYETNRTWGLVNFEKQPDDLKSFMRQCITHLEHDRASAEELLTHEFVADVVDELIGLENNDFQCPANRSRSRNRTGPTKENCECQNTLLLTKRWPTKYALL